MVVATSHTTDYSLYRPVFARPLSFNGSGLFAEDLSELADQTKEFTEHIAPVKPATILGPVGSKISKPPNPVWDFPMADR